MAIFVFSFGHCVTNANTTRVYSFMRLGTLNLQIVNCTCYAGARGEAGAHYTSWILFYHAQTRCALWHQIKTGPVVHLEHLPAKPIKQSAHSRRPAGSVLMRDNVKAIIPIVFCERASEREKKSTRRERAPGRAISINQWRRQKAHGAQFESGPVKRGHEVCVHALSLSVCIYRALVSRLERASERKSYRAWTSERNVNFLFCFADRWATPAERRWSVVRWLQRMHLQKRRSAVLPARVSQVSGRVLLPTWRVLSTMQGWVKLNFLNLRH